MKCEEDKSGDGEPKGASGGDAEPRGATGGFSFEAPKFSGVNAGSGAFKRFLDDLGTFFVYHKFNDELKLRFLPLCLTAVARDDFEALPAGERATYSAAVEALSQFFDRSSTLDAHSRLRELRFDPASDLNTFIVQFKKLVKNAFPGISSDQVLFHSFLSTLPPSYQQQIIAAGLSTFDQATEKVRNLIQSERVPTAVRQVSASQGEESVLGQILRRLEQLESRASRSDGRAPVARGRGADRGRGWSGRDRPPDVGGGDRRSCFACGSLTNFRRYCPHRQSRCYACGELGHLSRMCARGNEQGVTVTQSANQCPPKPH